MKMLDKGLSNSHRFPDAHGGCHPGAREHGGHDHPHCRAMLGL